MRSNLARVASSLILPLLVLAAGCNESADSVDSIFGSTPNPAAELSEFGNSALQVGDPGYDFGSVSLGASTQTSISIKNVSKTGVYLGTIVGSDTEHFSVLSTNCPTGSTYLKNGSECAVVIEFSPLAEGSLSYTIRIPFGSAPGSYPYQASSGLFGTGIQPPMSSIKSTISTSASSATADGVTTVTVTVALKDANSLPIIGKTVSLTSDRGASDTIAPATRVSNVSGICTFTVRSTLAGLATLSATDVTDGLPVTQKGTVNFLVGPVSPGNSLVSATPASGIAANNVTASTVVVTLRDAQSNPISGKTVSVASSRAGSDTITAVNAVTDAAGQARFSATSTATGTSVYSARDVTDSNLLISNTASASFVAGAVDIATSTVTASTASLYANGTTTTTITITLKDAYSNGVAGKTVTLASSRGGSDTISVASGASTSAGVVTFTVTSLTPGVSTFTATDVTDSLVITQTAGVTFNVAPPAGLSYSTSPATYTRTVTIASNTPSSTGGAVASYAVSPALPSGLALDTTTGVITGTATVLAPAATYTVTATNASGSTSVNLSITVIDVPPSSLTYTYNSPVYSQNTIASTNSPTSAGGPVVSYAVSPALPTGLSLNASTGVISGTPTVASSASTYTVTATNTGGSTTKALSISVLAPITSSTTLNTYAYISDATTSGATVNVDTTAGFSVGDKALVIQMQDYLGTDASGTHEYATVQSLTSTSLTFTLALTNSYYSGAGDSASARSAQVVRVPQYTDLAINNGGTVTATAWNGYKGGIIALDVPGQLLLNGTGAISADAKGFRGSTVSAVPGESQLGTGWNVSGGGGQGIGGANAAGHASYGTSGRPGAGGYFGQGGQPYGDSNLSKVHLGSAGGNGYAAYAGGTGGGAVLVTSGTIRLLGSGGITANGTAGANNGGSGSGGAIKLTATTLISAGNGLVSAQGGSALGGAGRIYLSAPSVTGVTSPTVPVSSGSISLYGFGNSVNRYAYVTDFTVSGNTVGVDSTNEFSIGDRVLVIQTQDYSATDNSGTYEFAVIQSKTSTSLTFSSSLVNSYTSGAANTTNAQTTQIVSAPQFTNVTLNSGSTLVPGMAWNGKKGGIIVFDASGALTLNGTAYISADSFGFRPYYTGGAGESQMGIGGACNVRNGGAGNCMAGQYGAASYGTSAGSLYIYGQPYGRADLSRIHLGSAAATYLVALGPSYGGGAILISAATINLTGTGGITAKGGSGYQSATGSGGAIKLTASTSMTIQNGLVNASGGGASGGAGRVYLSSPSISGTSTPTSPKSTGAITLYGSGNSFNQYAYVTTASASGSTVTVDTAAEFTAGDRVLVIQMQDYSASNASGTYEYATLQSKTATTMTFTNPLVNSYTSGAAGLVNAQTTQIVKVPQYTTVTLADGSSLQPQMGWNGYKGGILAFDATGAVTLNGTGSMTADAFGFRGQVIAGNAQGESQLGVGTVSTAANGGGGGGKSGGTPSGGAYGTSGTNGTGSTGGIAYGVADLSKLHLGSAGGTAGYYYQPGGSGGGAILVTASTLSLAGTGTITSNGIVWHGNAGQGAGGSIRIEATTSITAGTNLIKASITGSTTGGAGGDGRIRLISPSTMGTTIPTFTP